MSSYSNITKSRKPSSWTTSSAYPEYKKETKVYNVPVRKRNEYTKICRDIFDEISNAIVYDHYEWPFNKGKLAIRKYISEKPKINWPETKKIGKRVYFNSLETNGFSFTIAFIKGSRTTYAKDKASEEFKDKLKKHIKKSSKDPYVKDYDAQILEAGSLTNAVDYWENMKYLSTKYKNNTNACKVAVTENSCR